jgi:hypothetical protein
MDALSTIVGELVSIASGLIALYFFVSLVVNLAQAQVSTATGDVIGHARALQQGVASVILLAVASSANVLVPALQSYLSPESAPQTASAAFEIWEGLARFVVTVVLGGTGVLTAVGVVFAGLGAQSSHLLGSPVVLARSWSRLVIFLGGGILTLSSVLISNWLLSIMF